MSKSFYSKYKNFSQEKLNTAFHEACSNGNLDEVKYLLISPEIKEHADISYYGDTGLSDACWNGHLEIVKYLLTSPELKEHANLNDHLENDCGALLNACGAGHLEIVKYLLTSPDLKETAIIDWQFMPPLSAACESGHLEIVKYLLTSPEIKEHPTINIYRLVNTISKDKLDVLEYLLTATELPKLYNIHDHDDILFQRGIYHESRECIRYLIFKFNIKLTENIKKCLEEPEKNKEKFSNEVKEMFAVRKLANELSQELPYNLSNNKKNKL